MAKLFNVTTSYKGRTHTNLEISHNPSALVGQYIPAAALSTAMEYEFSPTDHKSVVIPKGKIVSLAGNEWDPITSHYRNAVKLCDGRTEAPLGVNAYNVYKRIFDVEEGNQPLVLRNGTIEVPLFTAEAAAAEIKWGAAWVADAGTSTNILGKYLKADQSGNFTVDANPAIGTTLGQVVYYETDIPMEGWLQYAVRADAGAFYQAMLQQSLPSTPGKDPSQINEYGADGFPFYWTAKNMQDWDKGIYKLTDGYFRSKKAVTDLSIDGIDFAAGGLAGGLLAAYGSTDDQFGQVTGYQVKGSITVAGAGTAASPLTFACTDYRGALIRMTIKDTICDDPHGITVKTVAANGTESAFVGTVFVDQVQNAILLYPSAPFAAARIQVATANLLIDYTPGVTTNSDYAGAIGLVRVKLML